MQRSRFHILVALVFLSISLTVFAQSQNPRQLFERARMLDESNQNLTEAIKLYGQVVKQAQEQRALAARAQLRVGLLYERLGRKAEAQRAFQAVVNQYADQADVARQARAKLPANLQAKNNNSATADATSLRIRHIPADYLDVYNVSQDGRYLIGEDREALIIHDLVTGEKRRLMNKPANKDEWFEYAIFSPDCKQIISSWGINKDKKEFYELRLIGIDGNSSRILYRADANTWIWPSDWSPDSKHILTVSYVEKADKSMKDSIMALISVADGSARILKSLSFEKGPGGFGGMCFSPDGRYIAYDYHPQNGSAQYDISVISSDGSRDVPLVQSLADDRLLGWSPDGKSIIFGSDRSKTIDTWMIAVADGKPQGSPELMKRGLGRVKSLGITHSGSFYYSPDLGARDIYIATLAPETGKLSGSPALAKTGFTGSNTIPDWSPDGRYLVYKSFSGAYAEDPAGVSQLFILNPETGEEREVRSRLKRFSSPQWFPDGKSILVRDQAGGAGLFKIDAETGDATLIAPEKPGSELHIPLLSRDGKAVFYQNKNILWKRNLETGEDKEIYRPTPPTEGLRFTGSIALSPDGQRLAFTLKQSLLVVPTTGGDARELLRLREPETFADFASDIAWTPDGRYLLFVKSNDMQSELWRIPADGGEQQKLGQLMGRVSGLRVHPDGQRLAFNLWHGNKAEVWVMENFLPTAQTRKTSVSRR